MTQSSHWEEVDLTKQISLIASIMLVVSSGVLAQSDEELIETVRSSAFEVYLEQASWVLPVSFHNSDLAEKRQSPRLGYNFCY